MCRACRILIIRRLKGIREPRADGMRHPLVGVKLRGRCCAVAVHIVEGTVLPYKSRGFRCIYAITLFHLNALSGQGSMRTTFLVCVSIYRTGAPHGILDVLASRQAFALQYMIWHHCALFIVIVVRILDVVDTKVEEDRHAYDVEQQDTARFCNERYLDAVEAEANGLTSTQDSSEHSNVMGQLLR
jgi:hypothetical protein